MSKATEEHSMGAARFVAEAEEKIITRFMEIGDLGDEYQKVAASKRGEFRDYARAMLITEFADRGYEIGEYHDRLAPMDGVDRGMRWRMVLMHDDDEVAYADIEINIGTMRMTKYGGMLE